MSFHVAVAAAPRGRSWSSFVSVGASSAISRRYTTASRRGRRTSRRLPAVRAVLLLDPLEDLARRVGPVAAEHAELDITPAARKLAVPVRLTQILVEPLIHRERLEVKLAVAAHLSAKGTLRPGCT